MKRSMKNLKQSQRSNQGYLVLFLCAMLVGDIAFLATRKYQSPHRSEDNTKLPEYTLSELAAYDGSDIHKPVYLALDGLVYDISRGRDAFYAPDKPYHMLAGTDASSLLHLVGGDIITQKYSVVGRVKL